MSQEQINGDLSDPAAFRTNLLEAFGEKPERMSNADVLAKLEEHLRGLEKHLSGPKERTDPRISAEMARIGDVVREPHHWISFPGGSFRAGDVTAVNAPMGGRSVFVHLSLDGEHVEIRIAFESGDERDAAFKTIQSAVFGIPDDSQ